MKLGNSGLKPKIIRHSSRYSPCLLYKAVEAEVNYRKPSKMKHDKEKKNNRRETGLQVDIILLEK